VEQTFNRKFRLFYTELIWIWLQVTGANLVDQSLLWILWVFAHNIQTVFYSQQSLIKRVSWLDCPLLNRVLWQNLRLIGSLSLELYFLNNYYIRDVLSATVFLQLQSTVDLSIAQWYPPTHLAPTGCRITVWGYKKLLHFHYITSISNTQRVLQRLWFWMTKGKKQKG